MVRRGLCRGARSRRARAAVGGLLVVPLVPRDGARIVRGPHHRGDDERRLRAGEGGPRGAPRRGRALHAGHAQHDRSGRLAHDRVPHPRRRAVLGRHVLPARTTPRHAVVPAAARWRHRGMARAARRGDGAGGHARQGHSAAEHRGGARRTGRARRDRRGAGRVRRPVRPGERRVRRCAQVPAIGGARLPAASRVGRPVRRRGARHGRGHAARHGRRRGVRPRGRRVPPVRGGRHLAGAPLREDALRQRAAAARLRAGGARAGRPGPRRHRRARGHVPDARDAH